jgi:hypothetical protein
MKRPVCALTLVWVCLSGAAAHAQVTINGGLGWSGGYDVGDATATLRTNASGTAPPPFTLFNVESRIAPSPGGEVRVGVAITPRLSVEGGVLVARRRLDFRIGGDREGGGGRFDGETVQNYLFDAGVLWALPVPVSNRVRVFAAGGGGYLRQLHQDRTLVESGQVFYAGGAARVWLRGRPDASRSIGVRGDVRMNIRRHGIDFENRQRIYPTISLLMFVVL